MYGISDFQVGEHHGASVGFSLKFAAIFLNNLCFFQISIAVGHIVFFPLINTGGVEHFCHNGNLLLGGTAFVQCRVYIIGQHHAVVIRIFRFVRGFFDDVGYIYFAEILKNIFLFAFNNAYFLAGIVVENIIFQGFVVVDFGVQGFA